MGIAGAGMSGLARILLERGVVGQRLRGARVDHRRRAAGDRRRRCTSATRRAPRRRRLLRLHDRDQPQAPRVRRGARQRQAVPAPRGGAGRRARGPAHRRDRRHARQDDDHVAADGRARRPAASTRPSPSAATCTRPGRTPTSGTGELAIVEADESDGSFLLTRPAAAIITNVEADHLENHGDLEGIFRAFEQFVDRVDPGGLLLDLRRRRRRAAHRRLRPRPRPPRCGPTARRRRRRRASATSSPPPTGSSSPSTGPASATRRGAGRRADRRAHGAQRGRRAGPGRRARARPRHGRRRVGRLRRRAPALRVRTARPAGCGSTTTTPTTRPRSRRAAPRRGGVAGAGRLIAVFQPGTYSRTQTFAREFAEAMAIADIAVVMDIFPAREEPIPGVTGATISDLIDLPAGPGRLRAELRRGARADRRARPARRPRPHDGHRQRLPAVRRDPRRLRRAQPRPGATPMTTTTTLLRAPTTATPPRPDRDGTALVVVRRSTRRRRGASLTWLVAFSPVLGARHRRGARDARADRGAGPRRRAHQRRARRWSGSTPPPSAPGRGAARRRLGARSARPIPSTVAITVDRAGAVGYVAAVGRTCSSTAPERSTAPSPPRRRRCRCSRCPAGAARAATGAAVAAVAAALPAALRAQRPLDPGARPDVDHAACCARPVVLWGSAERNADKARLLPALLTQPGTHFDVSDPDALDPLTQLDSTAG